MRPLITIAFCCVTLGATMAEAGPVALLPVEGDPKLADPLEKHLSRALARHGVTLLSVEQTERLLRAEKTISSALQRAGELLKRVDQALLRMKRAPAVAEARRAITALEMSGARFHSPTLLSRAHGRLAQALLLRPADDKGAAQAFTRAMTLDRSYMPDPDRTPPRVRTLASKAREAVSAPVAPAAERLTHVARAAQVQRLVWCSARANTSGTDVLLELVVFGVKDGTHALLHHQHHRLPKDQLAEEAALKLARALGAVKASPTTQTTAATSKPVDPMPASRPVAMTPLSPTPRPDPVPPPPTASPWYKKWWVWTLVGVVVVGGGVGLGVGLSQKSSSDNWDINFTF